MGFWEGQGKRIAGGLVVEPPPPPHTYWAAGFCASALTTTVRLAWVLRAVRAWKACVRCARACILTLKRSVNEKRGKGSWEGHLRRKDRQRAPMWVKASQQGAIPHAV
jgi:hypothetical protein